MELTVKRFDELTRDELYDILKLRSEIFILEQQRICREIDGKDREAIHVWISEDDGSISAYLRILKSGDGEATIGRVLSTHRKHGLGSKLLQHGIEAAKAYLGAETIVIHSQLTAARFYEKNGFTTISEPYMDEGRTHVNLMHEIQT